MHSTNRALTVSQKIYGWLLRAYPQAHRDDYGAAMAQLFRDQCRDAWKESQTWGLTKLWLRVLPDLVSTSIRERLAALNERKTMNEKLSSLTSDRTTPTAIFVRVFIAVFLITVIATTAITFILPETYASTARIKVEPDAPVEPVDDGKFHSNPYFVQTTFEVIQSQLVLSNVIRNLKLNEVWGKKYFNGETLKTWECIKILQARLVLAPVRNTKLISITVYSDERNEAAQIANAIAECYADYRHSTYMNAHPNLDPRIPLDSMVIFTDQAEPGRAPVRPNKTLNIFIGAVLGGFLGLVIGGAAAFAMAKLGGRGGKSTTLA